jgi:hypothetical protein
VEQPFKIPFAAAVVLVANTHKPEIAKEVLSRAGAAAQTHLENEAWREFKLHLRFLGLLQGLFEGEGVFPVLEDLFSRALDLQTASSEDVCLPPHPHLTPFLRLDWQKYLGGLTNNTCCYITGSRLRAGENHLAHHPLCPGVIGDGCGRACAGFARENRRHRLNAARI